MKKIYSLGGGCTVIVDIPMEYKADSIFKSFWATRPDIFLPLELFNGNLENEFLHKDDNWEIINVNSSCDWKDIQKIKKVNPNFISNYLVVFNIRNKNNGWENSHPQCWKSNPLNKYTFKLMFDDWNKNKYNLFYIIDFYRGGYEWYKNNQLLEFEDFLIKNNYDLNNFVYLDVSTAKIKDRFTNCKIQTFIQDVNDKGGYGYKQSPNYFRNTRCFFANHMNYVNNILGLHKND